MAVLAECPKCHRKQAYKSVKEWSCRACGENLASARHSQTLRYWVSFWVEGKQRREFVGYSKRDADAIDGERKNQKRNKTINDAIKDDTTFEELTEKYIARPKIKKYTTYGRTVAVLKRFNRRFGKWSVRDIRLSDLEEYQESLVDEGLAPGSVDQYLKIPAALVNWAYRDDRVTDRVLKPFQNLEMKLKKGENARQRTLTIPEYQNLVENASLHLRPLLIVGFHTGMRRGELLGLKWSYIDRENGFIRLPAEVTKEKKAKNIPINRYVHEALSRLPHAMHHDYVFTYRGKPITRDPTAALKGACRLAGIDYGRKVENGFTLHDLRATFCTFMDAAGVRESCRKTIVGHSLKGMDAHYIRTKDGDLRQAMDEFTLWFENQLENIDQTVDQNAINQ
jgi:integrase